jgi:hypothetical protein
VVDSLHYFGLERGKVIGSTSDDMTDGFESKTVDPKNWIVTLPAHLVAHNGLACIEEFPGHRTNIRVQVAD